MGPPGPRTGGGSGAGLFKGGGPVATGAGRGRAVAPGRAEGRAGRRAAAAAAARAQPGLRIALGPRLPARGRAHPAPRDPAPTLDPAEERPCRRGAASWR